MTELFIKRLDNENEGGLAGKKLLSYALSLHGVDYENAAKFKNEYGKEYLSAGKPFYNVSHTKNIVCVVISDKEVGVDCETVRPYPDHLKISKRFFTQNEYKAVIGCKDTLSAFFETWTKKESYIKYTGKGFAVPLPSFETDDIAAIQKTFEIDGAFVTVTGEGADGTVIRR